MSESILLIAFVLGVVSAVSLPMGALTTLIWHPSDRAIAILMAFGGGALLAALTIDLVASALQAGHFHALALGALGGGLLFVGLNQVLNNHGGFLRKVSTTASYLRRQRRRRLRRVAGQLRRVDLFAGLSDQDYAALAESIRRVEVQQGRWLHQSGDPASNLYIIVDGEAELLGSRDQGAQAERLKPYDVFGWRSVIAGAPVSHSVLACTEATLWAVPKAAVHALMRHSDEFCSKVQRLLGNDDFRRYLEKDQGLAPQDAGRWLAAAQAQLARYGSLPPAGDVRRNSAGFLANIECMQRIPLTRDLSPEAQQLISRCLLYKRHPRGTSFYHQHEAADRMYIIEHGEVGLFDATASRPDPIVLRNFDAFGDISMITGARHSVTAIASVDTSVWELRKDDFEQLLKQLPELRERVRGYVRQAGADGYLVGRQHMDAEHTARWMRRALHKLDAGRPLPAAADIRREFVENKGAPLAIWLGITLDGIPESLVIGASMLHTHLELSLIVGLFLANYPEALSSSLGMRKQGLSTARVVWMWTSLMLFTGLGAALGSIFFIEASPSAYALVQGLAAGAMLTMIAETMLPEAYFKGGAVVGLSTLSGFLVAIFSKTLE